MIGFLAKGLTVPVQGAPPAGEVTRVLTDEAALHVPPSEDLRADALVAEGEVVAQGQPLFRLHGGPRAAIVAPMAGRVAEIGFDWGQRLRRVTLFHDPAGGRHRHPTADPDDAAAVRGVLTDAGLWRLIRSRPFGRVPGAAEIPRAVFVMALDTRPGAPDPLAALDGQEEHFARGLRALSALAFERVFLCHDRARTAPAPPADKLRLLPARALHPWGLAGLQVLRHFPARAGAPVWDIAAEDVAAIGTLCATGHLPETRLVSVTGSGLRSGRLVRCQPWADLRGLAQGHVRPGPTTILSGSALEGTQSRWLHPRDRQATVLAAQDRHGGGHWFLSALRRASRPLPIIPSAAVEQALGGAVPAMPLLRALASGDVETATRLGALSLLAEDLALADYVTAAEPRLSRLLEAMLDGLAAEEDAA